MNQGLINLGLLLLIIPIGLVSKLNIYAMIFAMSLPCVHYFWLLNREFIELQKLGNDAQ